MSPIWKQSAWSSGTVGGSENISTKCQHPWTHHLMKVASRRSDQNCEICMHTKIKRLLLKQHNQQKCGDLTTDHKILDERWGSRNNVRCLVVTRDLTSQWVQSREKQFFQWTKKRVCDSFSSRQKSRKSITLTNHWNLANPVRTWHGIIVFPHFIGDEWDFWMLCAEKRMERCSVVAIWHCCLRNVQGLQADGRTPYEKRLREPIKGELRISKTCARLWRVRMSVEDRKGWTLSFRVLHRRKIVEDFFSARSLCVYCFRESAARPPNFFVNQREGALARRLLNVQGSSEPFSSEEDRERELAASFRLIVARSVSILN